MVSLYLKDKIDFSSFLPSFPSLKKVEETQQAKGPQEIKIPEGMVPFSFIYIKKNEHFLLCDKQNTALHLFRSEEDGFPLVKTFPCIVGSNSVDKREAGDMATPEGIYFLTSLLSGKNLPEKYGSGAFSLNYPNLLDLKEGKKGSGIWLHGYPDHSERPPFSEGCVVVKNEILKELIKFIKVGETPLVIVDSVKYRPREDQQKLLQSLSRFLSDWKMAWESRDTERYLRFYSNIFVSSDGKEFKSFREYKHRVNGSKKFIQLQIENKSFLLSRKDVGYNAILRINQDYRSDNFKSFTRKVLYLREEQGAWKIIGDIPL